MDNRYNIQDWKEREKLEQEAVDTLTDVMYTGSLPLGEPRIAAARAILEHIRFYNRNR